MINVDRKQAHTMREKRAFAIALRMITTVIASWFVWISDSGSVSVTDARAKIPAKHRAQAHEVTPPAIECGRRITLIGREGAASKCSAEQERSVAP